MSARVPTIVGVVVALFLFPFSVFASEVIINEFSPLSSPDWVEVYNISTESADLSLYKLQDASGNTLSLYGTILPSGFATFDWSNRLNNDGDTFSLYKNLDIVMTVTYGGQENICLPSSSGSIAWIPDGGNTYDRLSTSTKNLTNGISFTDPCPTPTATSTSTPTPTSISTPTNTPAPPPTNIPVPTKTPTPTLKPIPTFTTATPTLIATVSAVLGVTDSPETASVGADMETAPSVKPLIISLLLVGVGCGILSLVFVWKKKDACILKE